MMAVVFICDSCGKERRYEGVAWDASHMARKDKAFDFETLSPAYRPDGVADVCGGCFKRIQDAVAESDRAAEKKKRSRLEAALARFTPTPEEKEARRNG